MCTRQAGVAAEVSGHPTGFIRVSAEDLAAAALLLAGNPVYEAGGTVEFRALPQG